MYTKFNYKGESYRKLKENLTGLYRHNQSPG